MYFSNPDPVKTQIFSVISGSRRRFESGSNLTAIFIAEFFKNDRSLPASGWIRDPQPAGDCQDGGGGQGLWQHVPAAAGQLGGDQRRAPHLSV